VNGGGVGANGPLTRGSNGLSPGTKYKRSKNVFAVTSIALTLVPLGTKLLDISAQFLIGSPGTLLSSGVGKLVEIQPSFPWKKARIVSVYIGEKARIVSVYISLFI